MVNIDLLISVGIWITGVGMSAVGIEMTINPPSVTTKWAYRGAFILMGVAFIGLSVWQFDRADWESKRLAGEHLQEQLRNEGNIKYMQGQLDSVNKLLAGLTDNSDPKQIALLLSGMNVQRSTLKKNTLAICSEMEQWQKERLKTHPFPNPADPTKPTPKEQDAQNLYWQNFTNDYYTRFGPRVLSIVQQYGAKGVDVKMIEMAASNGYMPNNIVLQLRAFANRLDENGNLKN
jgi:hypothetical protein